jgi:hypothetical protein
MMLPLLLVHGIASNARKTFGTPGRFSKHQKPGSLFSFLLEQGYEPGRTLFWFSYSSLKPILTSAGRLQQEIFNVQGVTGSPQVDVVTFSLGGIISKYFAVSPMYHGEIAKLIMIAPPFLGSPMADFYKRDFTKEGKDLLFPGDSRAFTPQILSANHPLLLELSKRPFPSGMHTVIIAMKIAIDEKKDLLSRYHRYIAAWIGEGDQTVPVKSTEIVVNRHCVVEDSYAPGKVHGFLPNHAEIQKLVIQGLKDDGDQL